MFMIPTICSLIPENKKHNGSSKTLLLCLSNGNYDGLGKTREIELNRVGGILGFDNVVVVNHKDLQDSPSDRWSPDVVARVLEQHLPPTNASVEIYTFDQGGVSGHMNHIDTHLGVKRYLRGRSGAKAFQLQTVTNPFEKYIPVLHWLILLFSLMGLMTTTTTTTNATSSVITYRLYRPWVNWKCMAAHASQFVWYRRLFVVFSCYTYENRWVPLLASDQ